MFRAHRSPRSPITSAGTQNPLVQNDPALKLRLLVVKGNIDLEIDPPESRRDWEEVLRIAENHGMQKWAARAGGELAILTFLEGDTNKARNMMIKAVLLARFYGDVAAQIRYYTIIGQGFVEPVRRRKALVLRIEHWALRQRPRDLLSDACPHRPRDASCD
jgi:hypothetical protein